MSRRVLEVLDAVGDALELLTYARSHQTLFAYGGFAALRRSMRAEERRRIIARMRWLKERGLIVERVIGERLSVSLTARGMEKLLEMRLKRARELPTGRHIYVVFDVPERFRSRRDQLRHFLKSCGFKKIQQSLWAIDRDIGDMLRKWVRINKLTRWIRIVSD